MPRDFDKVVVRDWRTPYRRADVSVRDAVKDRTKYITRDMAHNLLPKALMWEQPFNNSTGNFRGVLVDPTTRIETGQLFGLWERLFVAQNANNHVGYVVYSYRTPIAWRGPKGWVVPPIRYSPSTGQHQAQVRNALNVAYDDAWPEHQKPIWPPKREEVPF